MNVISGHGFQYEIEDRVKNNGWKMHPEESYIDDVELKPRKVDFVAIKSHESYNPRGKQIALVVECKYLDKDHNIKFWFRDNPKDHRAYFMEGYNARELFLDESSFHFFTHEKVAVNLEAGKEKNIVYEAIMQASKGLIYLRQSPEILYTKGLFYPIVVYKGPGRVCDQDDNQVKDVLYYHQYKWRDPKTQRITTHNLYVDIIHESNLEAYLNDIFKKEMDYLMDLFYFKRRMEENRNRGYKWNEAR